MDKVKAFGFNRNGGPEVEEYFELDMPSPLADELTVEVRDAGVNPVDYKVRSGLYGKTLPDEFPRVLGSEVSGVVRKVGKNVRGFSVGDEVFGAVALGYGGFAEYTNVRAVETAPKPPQVSFPDAATLVVAGATAYDGVTQLQLQPGQTLLINGASGGVGVTATQIARDLDINVIGTASEDNRALIESLDATHVAYGDGVEERVRQLLPDGVDAIFDLAGGDSLRAVAGLVADRSKLISAGDPSVEELGGQIVQRERNRRVLEAVAAVVADRKMDPHVEDVRPFDEAAEAIAAVEVGHARGKVVLQIS